MSLNPEKTGLALGAFVGALHVLWALLVALEWAQPLVDATLRLHFITAAKEIAEFDLGTAMVLVIVATAVGYGLGFAFAHISNWAHELS